MFRRGELNANNSSIDVNMEKLFEDIRLQCKREGKLFVDTEFPASSRSIGFSTNFLNRLSNYRVSWMRPHEICKLHDLEPHFFLDGGSRFDLNQGELGDCWVVAAGACLSEQKRLLDRVVPLHQNFRNDWYAGIFHFRFWQHGNWVDVIVDDLLPTVYGRLIFVRSNQPNEFWGALLEKAYAKFNGSYETLDGGTNGDALTDFTGGVMETYLMSHPPSRLPHLLYKAFDRNSLVAASIYFQKDEFVNEVLQSGLVIGHAYSLTSIKKVNVKNETVHLVRIKNPWGNHVEWTGAWGDDSREWKLITVEEKLRLGLLRQEDGEFWMDLKDFIRHFDAVEICNLKADLLVESPKKWKESITHSQWKGSSAGGNIRYSTFWNNPQITFKVDDHDEDDDNLASFIIELTNKDYRKKPVKLAIGFILLQLKPGAKLPLGRDFHQHSTFIKYTGHIITRTLSRRFLLPPDDYIIIPTTDRPNREGEFSIRIITESNHSTGNKPAEVVPVENNVIDNSGPQFTPSQLRKYFDLLAGEDNAADAVELKKMLDYALKLENCGHLQLKFSTCKRLVALVDTEFSQKLEYQEFVVLWYQLQEWLVPYRKYDDKKGSINIIELKNSFLTLDYNLDQELIKKLIYRYSDAHGRVSFNNYIKCMAKLYVVFNQIQRSTFHARQPCDMKHEFEWMNAAVLL